MVESLLIIGAGAEPESEPEQAKNWPRAWAGQKRTGSATMAGTSQQIFEIGKISPFSQRKVSYSKYQNWNLADNLFTWSGATFPRAILADSRRTFLAVVSMASPVVWSTSWCCTYTQPSHRWVYGVRYIGPRTEPLGQRKFIKTHLLAQKDQLPAK